MAKKVLLIDEQHRLCRNFVAALEESAYEVVTPSSVQHAKDLLAGGEVELLLFCAQRPGHEWQMHQEVITEFPFCSVIYVLTNDCELEQQIHESEIRKVVRPLTDKKRFLAQVKEVIKIGEVYRQLESAEAKVKAYQEESQLRAPVFDSLDIGLMLDEMLRYFGRQLTFENLFWVRWKDVGHILEADEEALRLEADSRYLRTPRLRMFEEKPITEAFQLLRKTLGGRDLEAFGQSRVLISKTKDGESLLLPVQSTRDSDPLGCLMIDKVDSEDLEGLVDQIHESLDIMNKYLDFGYAYWEAKNLSYMDDLTQLYNQKYLPHVLDQEISRATRTGTDFSVLFMDVDYFKLVNDTHGHWVGSKLLVELGHLLKKSIRSCDYAFRYGGDEYMVVLVDTGTKGAESVAERIRKTVEETPFIVDGCKVNLTVSIGLAAFPQHAKSKEQLIQMADQAMYYGKNKSRNVVYVAS